MSQHIFAHSYLTESNPTDGEVIKERLQQLTLTFSTEIEQTSVVEVSHLDGSNVPLGKIEIDGNEIGTTFLQPLENGSYKVQWKIVGADGHPIEGEFSFTVDAPIEETPKEEKTEESSDEENQGTIEDKVSNDGKEENTQTEQSIPTYIFPSIVVALALVGIGCLWWLMRRK
ncbi:copper resistance CopC family protein [Litchfieldia alkalitelluris]|uniref:copper resistance CopC family protein n=1 Tax=Litchfieldia alkalitelluris TaxID=304268 RepID=UPI0019571223|nr:copper resistance protein CopC [Litchfieldia alkalitelluris]